MVSAGAFTADAQAFAQGRNIQLITGENLSNIIQIGANAPQDAVPASAVNPVSAPAKTASGVINPCPLCGGEMVARTAKRGGNQGQHFWGCGRYPACRGTRPL